MASLGHEVVAYDPDGQKITRLSQGDLPFFEPDLAELIKAGLASGKLNFTASLPEALENSDVHFLCVGTPQSKDSEAADLSQIQAAVGAMASLLKEGDTVVGKSTVPVGTASWVNEYLEKNSISKVNLVWNPEFLREGFAVKDTLNPDSTAHLQTAWRWPKSKLTNGVSIRMKPSSIAVFIKPETNAIVLTLPCPVDRNGSTLPSGRINSTPKFSLICNPLYFLSEIILRKVSDAYVSTCLRTRFT
jgi:UDPglucose 6-dehydrogenase